MGEPKEAAVSGTDGASQENDSPRQQRERNGPSDANRASSENSIRNYEDYLEFDHRYKQGSKTVPECERHILNC